MTDARVVLASEVGYDRVAAALAGWTGPLDLIVDLSGEPILARWVREGEAVRFSAIPDLGLRIVEGTTTPDLIALPATGFAEAVRLARSPDLASALRGVTILGLLEDASALPLLATLAADPATSAPVRGAAELAARRLGDSAVRTAANHLARRRERHPDRDPVLGLLGSPAARRQAIRWFRAEPSGDEGHRHGVILAGLADNDWEVRWSAVIAAHDLSVGEAMLSVRRCPIGHGPDAAQRRVLEAIRDVVGHRLARSVSRHSAASRVAALLDSPDDRPAPGDEEAFLLVLALRHPLPDVPGVQGARPLPRGYTEVRALRHWLGGGGAPVRPMTPATGFYIAVEPIAVVPAGQVWAQLDDAAVRVGRPLRLPTPDELEMALRGTDGRRYPWGNGRESGWRQVSSPWDLILPGHGPEWVEDEGQLLALPAARGGLGAPPVPASAAALRPVLDRPRPGADQSSG